MADTTRTGPAVQKLADGLRDDIGEAVGFLKRGLDICRALEGETKGVNGLSSILKAKGDTIAQAIADLEDEARQVDKKLLGGRKPAIQERVDESKAAEVAAARASARIDAGEPADDE